MEDVELRVNISQNLYRIMGKGNGTDRKISIPELNRKTNIPIDTLKHAKFDGIIGLKNLITISEALNVDINDLIYIH